VAGLDGVVDRDGDDRARSLRGERGGAAVGETDPFGVSGRDMQRTVEVLLPPRRVTQDRVRRERAPFPGREQERPVRIVPRRCLAGQLGQLGQELGDLDVDQTVGGLDALPRRLPRVVSEHDPRRALDDRVEQPVTGIGARAEAGPGDAFGVDL
jgi:hypothetical protein